MEHNIDKFAFIAEVGRFLNSYDSNKITSGHRCAIARLLNFINNIEAEDVIDLHFKQLDTIHDAARSVAGYEFSCLTRDGVIQKLNVYWGDLDKLNDVL